MKDIFPSNKNVRLYDKVKDYNNTQMSGEKASE